MKKGRLLAALCFNLYVTASKARTSPVQNFTVSIALAAWLTSIVSPKPTE